MSTAQRNSPYVICFSLGDWGGNWESTVRKTADFRAVRLLVLDPLEAQPGSLP